MFFDKNTNFSNLEISRKKLQSFDFNLLTYSVDKFPLNEFFVHYKNLSNFYFYSQLEFFLKKNELETTNFKEFLKVYNFRQKNDLMFFCDPKTENKNKDYSFNSRNL